MLLNLLTKIDFIWIVSCSWSNHTILLLMFVAEKSATTFGDLPNCSVVHKLPQNLFACRPTPVRLQNLPWSKTGLVSRQVLHPLSKLQNWIWSKTGRYKTGLVTNTKIEAWLRATKPKPWQSNLTSDTVEIFIQNEKAGLVPMQSRFRSRHKAGLGAGTKPVL